MLFRLVDEVLFTFGLPLLLLGVGTVYLIALRAFPYRHPIRTLRVGFGGNFRSGVKSLALALGGTLGVGNITGVALALAAGGAGALFWMWVSAAVAMFLKYGEIVLALVTRRRGADGSYEGGAMFYLKEKGGQTGRIAAFLFAFLCLLCALTLGAPVQSNTAAEACRTVLGIPPPITGIFMLVLTAIAVFGGVKRIGGFATRLIPFMSLLYLFLSLYATLSHVSLLPAALSRVVCEAFSLSSGAAGAGGFLLARAMRYGVTRGLLSNEAGAGTAPMAHAVAENAPASQGVMGVFEVGIDTFVFCTATAIPLLLAFPSEFPDVSGIELVMEAFCSLVGEIARPLLCVSLFLFAYATVLSWCFYGERAVGYLTGSERGLRAYLYLYIFLVGSGAYLGEELLWSVTDVVVSLLTMLHSACLLPLLPLVVKESRRAGLLPDVLLAGKRKGKRGQKRNEIFGKRGEKRNASSVAGVGKGQPCRVKKGAVKAATLPPIQAISANGMSDGRKV